MTCEKMADFPRSGPTEKQSNMQTSMEKREGLLKKWDTAFHNDLNLVGNW